jgi:hypothetical protein
VGGRCPDSCSQVMQAMAEHASFPPPGHHCGV